MSVASQQSNAASMSAEIASLLSGYSTETTPQGAQKIEDFRIHLSKGTDVFVTFLPGSNFRESVATAARLKRQDFNPVPHIAARSITDLTVLDDILRQLANEAGVEQVLVIAGAVDQPVGSFTCSMDILQTGLLDKHGIRRVGIAGHPEGIPGVDERVVEKALALKNEFAKLSDADFFIVTQFCFEAEPIIAWEQKIRAAGIHLPVRIGIPGLASVKTLLNYARLCGVGQSVRFVTKHGGAIAKWLGLAAPDKLILDLARYRSGNPETGIVGCHLYPLGGLEKTTRWANAVIQENTYFQPNGIRFESND